MIIINPEREEVVTLRIARDWFQSVSPLDDGMFRDDNPALVLCAAPCPAANGMTVGGLGCLTSRVFRHVAR